MGLLQKAVETYEVNKNIVGLYYEGHEPLAPVSHIVTKADIEIMLDSDGKFISARERTKDEPKIIIPATEESAGRTNKPCAHPLCDQLCYLGGYNAEKYDLYLKQLQDWNESEYTHPKLKPILKYIKGKSIINDLSAEGIIKLTKGGIPEKEKLFVCWNIPDVGQEAACWKDISLFNAFINYYGNRKSNQGKVLCMISGQDAPEAISHAKGIVPVNGNAKLISANDKSGYTYRGRFEKSSQAASISYEFSQKAHNALKWLISNQGVNKPTQIFGKRTFLCWNPNGTQICTAAGPFRLRSAPLYKPTEYKEDLQKTLLGYKTKLPEKEGVVIAVFDAATSGRLSLTYYNELMGSDFLERLCSWDDQCCWYNGVYGIEAPLLEDIVNCAYGIQRKNTGRIFLEADEKIIGQQIQRLMSCRVDKSRIPNDMVRRLVNQASEPQKFEEGIWRKCLFTACAVLNKYIMETKGENVMSWELDKADRSFQFGRLLAVMERAEDDFYYNTNKNKEKVHQTSAIKSLNVFKRSPWTTFERINAHLENAYIPRIKPNQKNRYECLRQEIVLILSTFPEEELNKPLDAVYLMGYDLQRNTFFTRKNNDENTQEE